MKKGDIVLLPFPFSDLTGNKLRPAVILISTNFDVTVCFITTQLQVKSGFDFIVFPAKINGLKKESLIRVSKFATIDKELVLGKIGKLDKKELILLNKNLIESLQLA